MECSWLKVNNFGLGLVIALKLYTSVTKGLKLNVRKFWGVIPTFLEVAGEKLVGGFPPSYTGIRSFTDPADAAYFSD